MLGIVCSVVVRLVSLVWVLLAFGVLVYFGVLIGSECGVVVQLFLSCWVVWWFCCIVGCFLWVFGWVVCVICLLYFGGVVWRLLFGLWVGWVGD